MESYGSMFRQLRWLLVLTKPLSELVAKANLERQGYRVYYPRVKGKVLRRGAWRDEIFALFPRYLFVQLNSVAQSLAPMRSTLGVTSVVRFGIEYVSVPDQVVEDIMSREEPESGLHCLCTASLFAPGSTVRVIEGAFSGLEGIFEQQDGEGRVVVLFNLLGRDAGIKLSAGSIQPSIAA